MPSTTAHFIVGAALALSALEYRALNGVLRRWAIPVTAGLLAASPDLDLAGRRLFGITDSSLLPHRGLFHSPFFVIMFSAALAASVAYQRFRQAFRGLWLLWGGCMLTHPLMDALTNGGRGVMLLLPFSRAPVLSVATNCHGAQDGESD